MGKIMILRRNRREKEQMRGIKNSEMTVLYPTLSTIN